MKRCHALAALVFLAAMPAALWAAPPSAHADSIDSLQSQYLAARTPEQRKQAVKELKALAKNSTADAGALNGAVAAMLPDATSTWEAEELLTIGAELPARAAADCSSLPADAAFLVDPRRASQAAGSAIGDVEALADIRVDHLRQDSEGHGWLALTHVQQIWRINSARGASEFSPRNLMYSGISQAPCTVRAQVLKRDGRQQAAEMSTDQAVLRPGEAMYFDARSRELRFAHLQAGDLVEVDYYLVPTPEAGAWQGYYARIDSIKESFPTRLLRRVLIAPSVMKLYSVARGLAPETVRREGDESIRIWEARGIGAEGGQGQDNAGGLYLRVSTFGSLEEFGRWYNHLLQPALQLDANLQNVARQIAARNLTTEGKVQAVYQSVKRLTRYTGFEFGVHSYQPYPVSLVERRGFGDCKDKAAMLLALLRAVNVPAEFAMVRTRAAGAVTDGAYTLQQFDHAMVYVPELNLYLDGTAASALPGPLPDNDIGATTITVDAQGNATWRTVLNSEPHLNPNLRMAQAEPSELQPAAQKDLRASMATQELP